MNINQLHDKLVKKANMKKVAGLGAIKLRNAIAGLNRARSNRKLVDELKQALYLTAHGSNPKPLEDALIPFIFPNKYLSVDDVLQKLKSTRTAYDKDLNKLIDRISNNIESRSKKIRSLGGYDVEKAFDQKLINKYIKDIPSK